MATLIRRAARAFMTAMLALLLHTLAGGAARAENRVALVIGNDHYAQLDPDHQLRKAINDAQAVGDALERDGFRVLRGTDLNRAAMIDKLFELSGLLQPGDTALFYFAGHGVALGSGNYLLPSDVPAVAAGQEMRIASQSLAEADVIASLQDRGARVAIVILDACRDNPFRKPGARSVGLERGFGRMPEANGVFSLYSAGYGQSALDRLSEDDSNPNSVFTRVLVPLLTRPGLNLDDLAYDVREQVAALAATTPDHHQQIPAAYDQIVGGRVYLASPTPAPGTAADAAPVPPAPAVQPRPVPPTTPPAVPPPAPVVAALEAPRPAEPVAPPLDRRTLSLAVQTELNRLGCAAGPPSGDWTGQARLALLQFGLKRQLTLNVDAPDPTTLDILRRQQGRVCPDDSSHPAPHVAQRAEPLDRRPIEHRPAMRIEPRRAAPRASCFMFNGARVCE